MFGPKPVSELGGGLSAVWGLAGQGECSAELAAVRARLDLATCKGGHHALRAATWLRPTSPRARPQESGCGPAG